MYATPDSYLWTLLSKVCLHYLCCSCLLHFLVPDFASIHTCRAPCHRIVSFHPECLKQATFPDIRWINASHANVQNKAEQNEDSWFFKWERAPNVRRAKALAVMQGSCAMGGRNRVCSVGIAEGAANRRSRHHVPILFQADPGRCAVMHCHWAPAILLVASWQMHLRRCSWLCGSQPCGLHPIVASALPQHWFVAFYTTSVSTWTVGTPPSAWVSSNDFVLADVSVRFLRKCLFLFKMLFIASTYPKKIVVYPENIITGF